MLIKKGSDLSIRRYGETAASEIDAVLISKEEIYGGSPIIGVCDRQSRGDCTVNLRINTAATNRSYCWHTLLGHEDTVLSRAEYGNRIRRHASGIRLNAAITHGEGCCGQSCGEGAPAALWNRVCGDRCRLDNACQKRIARIPEIHPTLVNRLKCSRSWKIRRRRSSGNPEVSSSVNVDP